MLESKEKTNAAAKQLINYCQKLSRINKDFGNYPESEKWIFLAKKMQKQIIK